MHEPASDVMGPTEMGSKVGPIECTIHNIFTYLDITNLAIIHNWFLPFDVLDVMHDRAAHF